MILLSVILLIGLSSTSTIHAQSELYEFYEYEEAWDINDEGDCYSIESFKIDLIPIGETSSVSTSAITIYFPTDTDFINGLVHYDEYTEYSKIIWYDDNGGVSITMLDHTDINMIQNEYSRSFDVPHDTVEFVIYMVTDYTGSAVDLFADPLQEDLLIYSSESLRNTEFAQAIAYDIWSNGFDNYGMSDNTSYSYDLGLENTSNDIDFDDVLHWVFMPFSILKLEVIGGITFGHFAFLSIMFGWITFLFKFKGGK